MSFVQNKNKFLFLIFKISIEKQGMCRLGIHFSPILVHFNVFLVNQQRKQ